MARVNLACQISTSIPRLWDVNAAEAWIPRTLGKRTFDIVVGVIMGIVTLPIVVILAVMSAVMLREWPFFTQARVGRQGRPIPFIKVRTLPSARVGAYVLKHDWRPDEIPRLMSAMRRLHLDEIPQLWLVVTGHLSLVGPRPKMPDDFEPVPQDYNAARVSVPQGCTCLWQIGQDTDRLPSQVPEYDYFYLLHGGLRLDLWILFWTGAQMVGLGGPKTIQDVPTWARSRGWVELSTSGSASALPWQGATDDRAAAVRGSILRSPRASRRAREVGGHPPRARVRRGIRVMAGRGGPPVGPWPGEE